MLRAGHAADGLRALRASARRGMLRAWNRDSLLVRGLVDNPSRGLSPALDRSTTFERAARRRRSPYGRGHAPVASRPRRCSARSRTAEATVFASGMTRLDVPSA